MTLEHSRGVTPSAHGTTKARAKRSLEVRARVGYRAGIETQGHLRAGWRLGRHHAVLRASRRGDPGTGAQEAWLCSV